MKPSKEILLGQGLEHHQQNRFDAAVICYKRLIRNYPDDISGWNNLGTVYREQKLWRSAINCFHQALKIAPEHLPTQANLAVVLKENGQVAEAITWHQKVIAAEPANPQWLMNYAASLRENGNFAEAVAVFQKAKTLQPDNKKIEWDIAQNLLSLNNYQEGLKAYESRWALDELPVKHYACPRWLGALKNTNEPQNHANDELWGKTILIHAEQGYGDTILAARYLPLVKAKVGNTGTVILQCNKELHRLFKYVGADQLILPEQEVGQHGIPIPDYHCPIMSLIGAFETTTETIPPPAALHIPLEARAKFAFMNTATNHFGTSPKKVGIVWRGSDLFKKNDQRSLSLSYFLLLAEHPNIRLYSLQKGGPLAALFETGADAYVTEMGSQCDDFADTAAVIENLDCVLMTDSSVAHVAASLGKRVTNLLGDNPYWIYMADIHNGKTPWYPSMKLAHKNKIAPALVLGDKAPVLKKMASKDSPTFTFLIPTHREDRPLERCLNSLDPQLGQYDSVIVIGDTCDGPLPKVEKLVASYGSRYTYLEYNAGYHNYGHSQLNYGLSKATGQWLHINDDDDIWMPGAVAIMREAASEANLRPLLFRFMSYHGFMHWAKYGLFKLGQIGGHCLVAPNIVGKIGVWGDRYEGDWDYVESTVALHGGPDSVIWHDSVIAKARPN